MICTRSNGGEIICLSCLAIPRQCVSTHNKQASEGDYKCDYTSAIIVTITTIIK